REKEYALGDFLSTIQLFSSRIGHESLLLWICRIFSEARNLARRRDPSEKLPLQIRRSDTDAVEYRGSFPSSFPPVMRGSRSHRALWYVEGLLLETGTLRVEIDAQASKYEAQ